MIYDAWINPLTGTTTSVLGYREDVEEFPHDIYSLILSSIRDLDRKDKNLIYRFIQRMNVEWESIHWKILSLTDLLSPDYCPIEFLDYLRNNVGITSDLDYLWGKLDTSKKRKFIKFFIRFVFKRGTTNGILTMVRTMLGIDVYLKDYFGYRWLISGIETSDILTSLGFEDGIGTDPYLLSEHDIPIPIKPDTVSLISIGGTDTYEFIINEFYNVLLNNYDQIPDVIRVANRPTGVSYLVPIFNDGDYKVRAPVGEYFDQPADYSTDVDSFYLNYDLDSYISDIMVEESTLLDKDVLIGLLKFSRPVNERFYIRYYYLIDYFEEFTKWDTISGTITHDEDNKSITLSDVGALSVIETNYSTSSTWIDYSLSIKAQNNTASKYIEIRFAYQDSNNYLYIRMTPYSVPAYPGGLLNFNSVVAGVDNSLATYNIENFDLDVDYIWKVIFVNEQDTTYNIQIYQDEALLISMTTTKSWNPVIGKVQLVVEDGGSSIIQQVIINPFPIETDFINIE